MQKKKPRQYQNSEMCKKCRERCCERCGCHFSPDDFPMVTKEILEAEIKKGYITLDLVPKDNPGVEQTTWIVRIRNRNEPIVQRNFRGGRCILQATDGCKLSFEKRPKGGRYMIPHQRKENDGTIRRACYQLYDIGECCQDWLPYQDIIEELVAEYENKDIPCSL